MAENDTKDAQGNKVVVSEDGTHLGDTTTDVVSKGGVKIGDIVFAVHDRDARDKPLSDIRKVPAIVTAVSGRTDTEDGQRVNVTVFHDSNDNVWFEDVTLYDKEAKDTDESNLRFKNGVYLVKSV